MRITKTVLFAAAMSFMALNAYADSDYSSGPDNMSAMSVSNTDNFGPGPDWGRGPGRPGPGRPGGPGNPPPRRPGPGYPPPPPGNGWHHQWVGAGTACGPYQPWGTSLQCPNTNPNGGPIGMNCDGIQPGTRCFGASYWNQNFACTDPYSGQTTVGTNIFNMYVCQ